MPIIKSFYKAPLIFRNYHISTIYASVFRKVKGPQQTRRRLELQDGDFLDVDLSFSETGKSKRLLIVLHGLEGNSQRPYVLGMAKQFNKNGWNVAAVNFRSCSGEINRLFKSYNAGASKDLEQVIFHLLSTENYDDIGIVGFSLGGNLLLKYLGEGSSIPAEVKAAVAISVPCDLYGSVLQLQQNSNFVYTQKFLRRLKSQLHLRQKKFPDQITREQINSCKSIMDVDDLYTSKAHGFKNARDYYKKSSAINFLENIKIPTLILNAKNDNFLSEKCYPSELAERHDQLLEMPSHGGHVGFLQKKPETYAEERALEFIRSYS